MQAHTFDCFSEDLGFAKHDFAKHAFTLLLTLHKPEMDCSIIEELRAIGTGFPVQVTWARSGAKSALAASPVLLKAEGADIGPFAYGAIVNATSGRAVACFDTGEHTLKAGESLEIRFPSIILSVGG